jgi:small subunit ribosomal protein S1
LDVYVLDVDRERKRIALSLKKLQPDPWTLVDDHYHVGQLIEGRVTRVLDFGAFVEVDLGVEGLLHSSEMIGTPELNPKEIVHSGEKLPVKIIRIDGRRRRLALSARQVRRSEWEQWVAEQQAAHEAAEDEAEASEAEVAVSVAIEEQASAPEAEIEQAEIGEVAGEEAQVPEAELAVGEAIEEEAEAPEAETTEVVEEEAEVPEAELAVGEAIEEGAEAPEAEATEVAEEEALAPVPEVGADL